MDQFGRHVLVAVEGGEEHRAVGDRRIAGRFCDRTILFDEGRGRGEVAGEHLAVCEDVEGELQLDERA